jgi:hypothetical protein
LFASAIFYLAMLENKEENRIKLLLYNQYRVRFGPSPRPARLTHLFNINEGETHVFYS